MQSNSFLASDNSGKPLGSYLVEAGLLTQAHIDVALADQQVTGARLGEIIVTRGWIKEQTIEYLMDKVILPERGAVTKEPSPEQAAYENSYHVVKESAKEHHHESSAKGSPIAKQKLFVASPHENDCWIG